MLVFLRKFFLRIIFLNLLLFNKFFILLLHFLHILFLFLHHLLKFLTRSFILFFFSSRIFFFTSASSFPDDLTLRFVDIDHPPFLLPSSSPWSSCRFQRSSTSSARSLNSSLSVPFIARLFEASPPASPSSVDHVLLLAMGVEWL